MQEVYQTLTGDFIMYYSVTMDLSTLLYPILRNQVVTGLSFTAILGAVAYQLRNIPSLIHRGILRFFTVKMTVMSTDAAFEWTERWLAQQPYALKSKMMRLRSNTADDDAPSAPLTSTPVASSDQHNWNLTPGDGMHVFWWHRRPIFLERLFLSKEAGDRSRGKPVEMIHLRTFGRSQEVIRRLVAEVRQLSVTSELVSIRMWSEYYWVAIRGKSHRPLDTIILKPGQAERLIDDIQWFLTARDWYKTRGIPYRRGYLLIGPPGTGKTSIVLALAGHLNKPVCVLNLGSLLDDDALFHAFFQAPSDALVLIEDVDCASASNDREANAETNTGKLSQAALLNALDGISTPDGRIFIMTTNFPERLDRALIRPGRADVHEEFGYLDAPEQVRMAARFYDTPFEPLPFPLSPAVMQAVFMEYSDPDVAREVLFDRVAHDPLTA